MEITIKEITDKKEKEIISRDILNDLPEWFGMPDSTEEYIKDSQDKSFLACFCNGEAIGFVETGDMVGGEIIAVLKL